MASYKQPCIHCGTFIESDSRFCPDVKAEALLGISAPPACAPSKKANLSAPAAAGRLLFLVPTVENRLSYRTDASNAVEH